MQWNRLCQRKALSLLVSLAAPWVSLESTSLLSTLFKDHPAFSTSIDRLWPLLVKIAAMSLTVMAEQWHPWNLMLAACLGRAWKWPWIPDFQILFPRFQGECFQGSLELKLLRYTCQPSGQNSIAPSNHRHCQEKCSTKYITDTSSTSTCCCQMMPLPRKSILLLKCLVLWRVNTRWHQ